METMTSTRIVGIRFQELGKLYHFDAAGIPDLKVGDQVLVSTSRGREMGEVAGFVENPAAPPEGPWKAVERLATAQELVQRRLAISREIGALRAASGGTRLSLAREQQVLSRFRAALGPDGAALGMMLLRQGRGRL